MRFGQQVFGISPGLNTPRFHDHQAVGELADFVHDAAYIEDGLSLLVQDFTFEDGMLTQILKLKRRVVLERYRDVIEKLYVT